MLPAKRAGFFSASLLVAFCGTAAPAALGAQTVVGRLLDAETQQPILAGVISVLTPDGEVLTRALSDPAGAFVLAEFPSGSVLLHAQRIGYLDFHEGPLDLAASDTLRVELRLAPSAVELDSMVIALGPTRSHLHRSGFYQRMRAGVGRHIAPERIESMKPTLLSDLMRRQPSVRLVRSRIFNRYEAMLRDGVGFCRPTVFVDGRSVNYERGWIPFDDIVAAQWVEAVEIYSFAGAPPEFAGWNRCGVILIWTKT